MRKGVIAALCLGAFVVTSATPLAQRGRGGGPPGAPGGPGRGGRGGASTIERITVHGKALEASGALQGNAQGDSADRAVTVYLPPSYAGDQNRRFPTVYMLHGEGGTEGTFLETAALQQSGDRLAAAQGFSEFIVVTPNASVKGPMYSSTPVAGDWERFVAEDLVAYIDGHYRTLAHRMSRGLAGHGTGAGAAVRIGMKHPELFADIYAMSPSGNPVPSSELEKLAGNLNAFYAIAIDIGRADPAVEPNRQMHAAMTRLRIAHTFEEYDGDHSNRLRERLEWNVLPFFARNLAAPANLTSPSPAADRLASPSR
jgi:S-formylglutathione hydrolase FrmB